MTTRSRIVFHFFSLRSLTRGELKAVSFFFSGHGLQVQNPENPVCSQAFANASEECETRLRTLAGLLAWRRLRGKHPSRTRDQSQNSVAVADLRFPRLTVARRRRLASSVNITKNAPSSRARSPAMIVMGATSPTVGYMEPREKVPRR